MTFQTFFLILVPAAFGTLFAVLMWAWITTSLHERKQARVTVQSTPARRPEPEPLKLAA